MSLLIPQTSQNESPLDYNTLSTDTKSTLFILLYINDVIARSEITLVSFDFNNCKFAVLYTILFSSKRMF
jgi:hypothetical protein